LENKEDLYVIGFPKSGNTWLARLLSDITNSKIYVESDNDKINNSENSDDKNGSYLIHEVHGTHDLNRVLKSKKVYILRDPRAAIVSGFFHNYRNLTEDMVQKNFLYRMFFVFEIFNITNSWNNTLKGRLNRFKKFLKRERPMNIGSWAQHVLFWSSKNNIVIVKYEDLLDNKKVELERILKELNIKYSDELISKAVQNQSFSKKKKEFLEKGDTENAKFLRSGKKESWKELLKDRQIRNIEKKYKEAMKQFSYEREHNDK